ncbi:MAG TPA: FtsX-like permease family protein, partial [Blastocatellia bacterium]|nr:FtsX-like permease family protein [Blastocatellia bacterium]
GLITFDIQLPQNKYDSNDKVTSFFNQTLDRLKAIPGVQSAAATLTVPLSGNGALLLFYAEGHPARGPEDYTAANFDAVSSDYFSTMETPIIRGRGISEQDKADSDKVVVVSDSMAKKFFGGADAIGKRLKLGGGPGSRAPWVTIVGIAADSRHNTIEDKDGESTMYFPLFQRPDIFSSFVVRGTGDLTSLSSELRNAVQGVDKDQPIANVKTMDQVLLEYNAQRRLITLLIEIFALIALVLSSIGVYGVMAYSVNQRTHELGIRLALGARRTSLLTMVLWRGVLLAGTGVALGIGAAFGLTRLMVSLLFNVSPTEPSVFAGVSTVLILVALLASLIPAIRATRVDPMVTLRYE